MDDIVPWDSLSPKTKQKVMAAMPAMHRQLQRRELSSDQAKLASQVLDVSKDIHANACGMAETCLGKVLSYDQASDMQNKGTLHGVATKVRDDDRVFLAIQALENSKEIHANGLATVRDLFQQVLKYLEASDQRHAELQKTVALAVSRQQATEDHPTLEAQARSASKAQALKNSNEMHANVMATVGNLLKCTDASDKRHAQLQKDIALEVSS